tara:strand:- start:1420 stop:1983 length:564 start_codon:yes stop_codon:yes gene_type:complete
MRIISGQFKGKKLLEPIDKKTRPLKDLVKESLFNIIKHSKKLNIDLEKSNVLDLFAGVGSFGLEALSRGAKDVLFIENYNEVVKILKKNIENLDLNKKCDVLEKDIMKDFNFKELNKSFDIIYLDPPFKEKNINLLIMKINKSNILKTNGIIILHRHKDENDQFIDEFNIVEEKQYGISKIIFLSLF